jgi:hypothetical protein
VLWDEHPADIDAIVAHLKARAKAMSGGEDDIDWDETHGSD